MRIVEARIHNYRSVKDLTLQCEPLVALVGPNNAGKSNILGALEFALTPGAKPPAEDLFAFHDPKDSELWIELEFVELTEQENHGRLPSTSRHRGPCGFAAPPGSRTTTRPNASTTVM